MFGIFCVDVWLFDLGILKKKKKDYIEYLLFERKYNKILVVFFLELFLRGN